MIDNDTLVNRAVLRGAIARQIFCEKSGQILDIRTSVLVTITHQSGNTKAMALIGSEWDKISANAEVLKTKGIIKNIEIIDGRIINNTRTRKGRATTS